MNALHSDFMSGPSAISVSFYWIWFRFGGFRRFFLYNYKRALVQHPFLEVTDYSFGSPTPCKHLPRQPPPKPTSFRTSRYLPYPRLESINISMSPSHLPSFLPALGLYPLGYIFLPLSPATIPIPTISTTIAIIIIIIRRLLSIATSVTHAVDQGTGVVCALAAGAVDFVLVDHFDIPFFRSEMRSA